MGRSVLLVSPSNLSKIVAASIRRAGCHVTVARSFDDAKALMAAGPDLLVTELKLGEFNGLHLAVRGRVAGIPSIVVGDQSFEQDVEQLGAVWMSPEDAASGELHPAMTRLLQGEAAAPLHPWFDNGAPEPVAGPEPEVLVKTSPLLQ